MLLLMFGPFSLVTEQSDEEGFRTKTSLSDINVSIRRYSSIVIVIVVVIIILSCRIVHPFLRP